MANNGYRIICFEQGAMLMFCEQLNDYSVFSCTELMNEILPSIRNDDYERFYTAICVEKNILLKDMEQVDGRQATIEIINCILKERVKLENTTILIGEYIVDELLADISEDLIFCTNKTE